MLSHGRILVIISLRAAAPGSISSSADRSQLSNLKNLGSYWFVAIISFSKYGNGRGLDVVTTHHSLNWLDDFLPVCVQVEAVD